MHDTCAEKTKAAWFSVVSNTTLVIGKLSVGLWIGSVSVISEAIHSGVDLLASFIALFAVRTASLPADEDHPFGHGKVENISGVVEAILILLAAGWIFFEAVHKLLSPRELESPGWGVAVMLVSALANQCISTYLFKVGNRTDSVALQADAWHLRTDVFTSAGVMGGLLLIWIGNWLFPTLPLHWLDPVAAMVVALLIVKAGWKLTMDAGRDLLDARLPAAEEAWIGEYITRLHPTVRGYHNLRTRKSGSVRFIEFHLIVEAAMSVVDAHYISEVMSCDIEEHFPGSHVAVHVEPCDGICKPVCLAGCLLNAEDRERLKGQ